MGAEDRNNRGFSNLVFSRVVRIVEPVHRAIRGGAVTPVCARASGRGLVNLGGGIAAPAAKKIGSLGVLVKNSIFIGG